MTGTTRPRLGGNGEGCLGFPADLADIPVMTRLAAIADIHGNADALAAVLADIAAHGITRIVNLGDHFSGPLAARETAELLLSRTITTIRGNHDRYLLETPAAEMAPSDKVAFRQLDSRHIGWLRDLPPVMTMEDDIFLCHGTPRNDTTYWLERVCADGRVVSNTLAGILEEAEGVTASLILCGHSHQPRRVDIPDGRVILNPGSVGCPAYVDDLPVRHVMQAGTPAACYAIAERQGNGAWSTTFRHVPYDTARMVALAEAARRPEWASGLKTGWIS